MEHPVIACGPHDCAPQESRHPRPLVLYGCGELARTTLKLIRQQRLAAVAAVAADRRFLEAAGSCAGASETPEAAEAPGAADRAGAPAAFAGLPLVAFEEIAERFPPATHDMLVLIGYKRMRERAAMFARAKERGYRLANLISPSSQVAEDVELGENVIIGDFVFIGSDVRLGNQVIIRPSSHIGHHTRIDDHAFIAPGCMIASACRIGELSYLGIGVTVIEKVTLGRETLAAAGSVVCGDVAPHSQVLGNPAAKVGEHPETGIMILR
jgi:sugar O-acyltransferase (sialic acid O-acetyltransferase NeuD family)